MLGVPRSTNGGGTIRRSFKAIKKREKRETRIKDKISYIMSKGNLVKFFTKFLIVTLRAIILSKVNELISIF